MHVRRSSRSHLIAPASVNLWIAHYLKHVFQRRLARRMSRCASFGVYLSAGREEDAGLILSRLFHGGMTMFGSHLS
jgi:hypothetical protein